MASIGGAVCGVVANGHVTKGQLIAEINPTFNTASCHQITMQSRCVAGAVLRECVRF